MCQQIMCVRYFSFAIRFIIFDFAILKGWVALKVGFSFLRLTVDSSTLVLELYTKTAVDVDIKT